MVANLIAFNNFTTILIFIISHLFHLRRHSSTEEISANRDEILSGRATVFSGNLLSPNWQKVLQADQENNNKFRGGAR